MPADDKTSLNEAMVKGNTLFLGAVGAGAERASFSVTIEKGTLGILLSCFTGGLLVLLLVVVVAPPAAAGVLVNFCPRDWTRSISWEPHLDDPT